MLRSHSARSAWIETRFRLQEFARALYGRTPQGVRGLKLGELKGYTPEHGSHSARSAWIETVVDGIIQDVTAVALRKECVD